MCRRSEDSSGNVLQRSGPPPLPLSPGVSPAAASSQVRFLARNDLCSLCCPKASYLRSLGPFWLEPQTFCVWSDVYILARSAGVKGTCEKFNQTIMSIQNWTAWSQWAFFIQCQVMKLTQTNTFWANMAVTHVTCTEICVCFSCCSSVSCSEERHEPSGSSWGSISVFSVHKQRGCHITTVTARPNLFCGTEKWQTARCFSLQQQRA